MIRRAAVAGSWYPASAVALAAAVDAYLAAVERPAGGRIVGLIAPHAGLKYSGPVAAHAYRQLSDRPFDLAVLVGPSHFVGFDGVAIHRGGFDSPLGVAELDEAAAAAITAACPIVREHPSAHAREHSLEMQLPFLKRIAPAAKIVPLLMGWQTAATVSQLGVALGAALQNRDVILIASTDLSHYHDAATAAALDAVVIEHVSRFDADGLQRTLDARPEHACGGGPAVAVMRAAARLGARQGLILRYADSGDVSGDKAAVVGYLAAALGDFDA
jgi:AmmeMemoRadiSam system protein B